MVFEILRIRDFIVVIYTVDTFIISLPIHIVDTIAVHLAVFCFILFGQITLNVMQQTIFILLPAINMRFLENSNTLFDNMSKTRQRIINFITEHNTYCVALTDYNRFWSKLVFAFLGSMFPCCFMLQHILLFIKFKTIYVILIGIYSTIILIGFFSLSFSCAYMSKHIHRTAVPLSRLQWRLKGIRYSLLKLKLMTYFERLSSTRRIGVTLGPTIVLTIPIFFQVIIKR